MKDASFAVKYLCALVQSGQLTPLERRQLRFLYQTIHPGKSFPKIEKDTVAEVMVCQSHSECQLVAESIDEPLLLLLTLLFAELHNGSIVLPASDYNEFIEAAMSFANVAMSHEESAVSGILSENECLQSLKALYERVKEISFDFDKKASVLVKRHEGFSFQRLFRAEEKIKQNLTVRLSGQNESFTPGQIIETFASLDLPASLHYRQAAAVFLCCYKDTVIISGGPGTGKTTVVLAVIRTLLRLDKTLGVNSIALSAPTGRAAARLQESILQGLVSFSDDQSPEHQCKNIKSTTLHRLLGYDGSKGRNKYNRDNPLPYALVVVDEVSMIDVHLFASLLEALAPGTKLVLLGDRNQLPSVDAGAILGDLTSNFYLRSQGTFTDEMVSCAKELMSLSNSHVSPLNETENFEHLKCEENHQSLLEDHVVILTRSYRFRKNIAKASETLLNGVSTLELKRYGNPLIEDLDTGNISEDGIVAAVSKEYSWEDTLEHWSELLFPKQWFIMAQDLGNEIGDICEEYIPLARQLIEGLGKGRILCPLRSGACGVEETNAYLQKKHSASSVLALYSGMPIMIRSNDYSLGIYNGDVGVIVGKHNQNMRALFFIDNTYRLLPVEMLPDFEAAYAITIHKSQGSEFTRILVGLPQRDNVLITRELLFTAITRCKTMCEIFNWERCWVSAAMSRAIRRRSGLRV
ncbi:exodeoxyribonuclease V subunit alpha [Chitinispirillales bacterium ANBcel5]|uniref:exodeoxyribonuclease V subunit alpha n=1 Tax=Cellulosispirillum alkaliphilum TaxID=3039283 RepID=UPI002A5701B3|nr:exodeoxyribonuclease V subunit alpha [Chitinispirillales bacterium ANBcel5]